MGGELKPGRERTAADEAADRRTLLGRVAGLLFLSGAVASFPANHFMPDPEPAMWGVYATNVLALVSGLVAVFLPWRRLGDWALHAIPPIATIEIVVAVYAGQSHGSVFAWYFILGAIYVGYAFPRRRDVGIHAGVIAAGMLLSALLTLPHDPDALVRMVVAIPTVIVGAFVIAWLRGGMETSQRELHALAESRRREARTDQLTGLGNRRKLLDDLELALRPGRPPSTLVMFDLDGFKPYNDQFGHPAGDGLLSRLGRRLADAIEGRGEAYRLGGDEFCVLLERVGDAARPAVAAASAALIEKGESFEIGASHGSCEIPAEASTPTGVLQCSDKRLYADKHRRRASAGQQASDVLLTLLNQRRPDLGEHVASVAELARATARRLGLDEEEIDVTVRAAELHDIGKAAIPDEILGKPGPLDKDERSFVERHTVVGEHILNAAQALRPVARLVRSSHERFDGTGYPDGLAGEQIPIGARIIAVCDAYEAMLSSDRRHRDPRTPEQAAAELRRGAGTQFDPLVVQAFVTEIERRLEADPTVSTSVSARPSAR